MSLTLSAVWFIRFDPGASSDFQRNLDSRLRVLAKLQRLNARRRATKLWVWIGDRSIFVRSRKRMADGQTPGEPMQPRTVRFLIWILPRSTGNLLADVDADHRDPAFGTRILEHVGQRRRVTCGLDDEVGAALGDAPSLPRSRRRRWDRRSRPTPRRLAMSRRSGTGSTTITRAPMPMAAAAETRPMVPPPEMTTVSEAFTFRHCAARRSSRR